MWRLLCLMLPAALLVLMPLQLPWPLPAGMLALCRLLQPEKPPRVLLDHPIPRRPSWRGSGGSSMRQWLPTQHRRGARGWRPCCWSMRGWQRSRCRCSWS